MSRDSIGSVVEAYDCKHFSIGLPAADEDQSLTALFRHVASTLAQDEPISMDDVLAIGFETELGDDAKYRGFFTIVFRRDDASPSP
ncbi:hypothetical protein [Verrucosispora sioxanthis]|uniref:Uncharacterized protein n=1 Tax=Verrucosispora sioxanthis TaxID=2499994 RepID=A0A6M1KUH2_9ACTN|nr:hypothetical protein [Verrucosispora sioxanthis]NEE63276.1 hypothetical protein [Verrucosispora sioxanthis]NGM12386.1 hypothetical protein [Verrucosispora sioxanthis]